VAAFPDRNDGQQSFPQPSNSIRVHPRSSAVKNGLLITIQAGLDPVCNNYMMHYMPAKDVPTSIRLSQEEKRRIATGARKHGISVAAFIKRAALGAGSKSPDAGLARLEEMAKMLLDAIEAVRDYRMASESWDHHIRNKTRLYTGEELKREMGLSG